MTCCNNISHSKRHEIIVSSSYLADRDTDMKVADTNVPFERPGLNARQQRKHIAEWEICGIDWVEFNVPGARSRLYERPM